MALKICVVGSGVVGEATGRGFLARGHQVIFADISAARVHALRAMGLNAYTMQELSKSAEEWDLTLLTVSTPTENGAINLSHLLSASRDVGQWMRRFQSYHVVVVRSTVPPGTTEDVVAPILESTSGKSLGTDFGVGMNPEYLREATAEADFHNPWMILIGANDERAADRLVEAYEGFTCPLYRVSPREAELQKYLHNLFNATKISFFNEMRRVCLELGLDADAIFPLVAQSAEGMLNPAYGTRNRGPFDGKCLPKDTTAFLAWARERGLFLSLLHATIQVNEATQKWWTAPAPSIPDPVLGTSIVAEGVRIRAT